jgi:hypothetical protein
MNIIKANIKEIYLQENTKGRRSEGNYKNNISIEANINTTCLEENIKIMFPKANIKIMCL